MKRLLMAGNAVFNISTEVSVRNNRAAALSQQPNGPGESPYMILDQWSAQDGDRSCAILDHHFRSIANLRHQSRKILGRLSFRNVDDRHTPNYIRSP